MSKTRKEAKTAEKTEIGVMLEAKERRLAVFKEVYPIQEPYVYAAIVKDPETQKIRYEVIEPTLTKEEEEHLKEVKAILMEEIDVNQRKKPRNIFAKKRNM